MENENKSDSFVIHDPEALYEAAFQSCWDHLADGAVLTESGGTRVEILSRGEWNHEAGPDFKTPRSVIRAKSCAATSNSTGKVPITSATDIWPMPLTPM